MYPHSVLYLLTRRSHFVFFFFFNDTATTEIYTLSLHDALPILVREAQREPAPDVGLAAQRARTYPGVLGAREGMVLLVHENVLHVVRAPPASDVRHHMLERAPLRVGRRPDGVLVERQRVVSGWRVAAAGVIVGPLH